MGGFLGVGKSDAAKALEEQNRLKEQEAERARRDAEIRLAEKKARKGQEIANVKVGTLDKKDMADDLQKTGKTSGPSLPSNSLGIGGSKGKTGVQL